MSDVDATEAKIPGAQIHTNAAAFSCGLSLGKLNGPCERLGRARPSGAIWLATLVEATPLLCAGNDDVERSFPAASNVQHGRSLPHPLQLCGAADRQNQLCYTCREKTRSRPNYG